jgi:uncharacterized protein YlxW (UPF0749 family)
MIIPLDDRGSFKIPGVVVQIYDVKRTNQQVPMLRVGSAENVIAGRSLWKVINHLTSGRKGKDR